MTKRIIFVAVAVVALGILITILRIYALQKDVSQFRSYWMQRSEESKDKDAFVYIALGDSTAQGIGASAPDKGYVGLVADYLASKTGKSVHVINLSVSGATIEDVLKDQLPKMNEYPRPDLVTIEIGANDIPSYNEQAFRSSFTELAEKLPPQAVVSNIPSFRNGIRKSLTDETRQASSIADEILSQTELTRVDLFTVTDTEIGYFDTAADFFHPNDTAYKKWAETFIKGIKQ